MNYIKRYVHNIMDDKLKSLKRQTEITSLVILALQRTLSTRISEQQYTKTVATINKGLETYASTATGSLKAVISVYQNMRLPWICKIPTCYLLMCIAGMAIRRLEAKALITYGSAS